jgi:hypothetical protein
MEESSDAALPSGWVPLGASSWWQRITAITVIPTAIITVQIGLQAMIVSGWVDRDITILERVLIGLIGALVPVLLVVAVARLRTPRPSVNFDTGEIRFGRRTIPMSDVRFAKHLVVVTKRGRSDGIVFGAAPRLEAAFRVRQTDGTALDPDTARLVVEVLRRSSVVMPSSRYDPTGRFAKHNFPSHLSREEAIELVLRPQVFADQPPPLLH